MEGTPAKRPGELHEPTVRTDAVVDHSSRRISRSMTMKKRITTLCTLALISTALTGCLPAPVVISQKAAQVQVHRQVSNLLDSCRKLGPVSGTVSINHDNSTDTDVKIREATADMGGDTVVLLNLDITADDMVQQGIAFKCY
jgi:hypothetical protein